MEQEYNFYVYVFSPERRKGLFHYISFGWGVQRSRAHYSISNFVFFVWVLRWNFVYHVVLIQILVLLHSHCSVLTFSIVHCVLSLGLLREVSGQSVAQSTMTPFPPFGLTQWSQPVVGSSGPAWGLSEEFKWSPCLKRLSFSLPCPWHRHPLLPPAGYVEVDVFHCLLYICGIRWGRFVDFSGPISQWVVRPQDWVRLCTYNSPHFEH